MKVTLFILALIISMGGWVGSASAHILAIDGSTGAIMHVEPNDDPIVGQPASIFFDIKDKDNKLQLENCDCRAVVYKAGEELTSQPLTPAGANSLSFSYIFPHKDVYTVKLVGTPIQANAFQSFNMSWDFRVSRESTPSGQSSVLMWSIIGTALISLGAGGWVIFNRTQKG